MKVEPMSVSGDLNSYKFEPIVPAQIQHPELTKEEFEKNLQYLSKARIEQLTTTLRHYYMTKYHKGKRRIPKYGNLDKNFSDEQINRFFRAIDDNRFFLLFKYQSIEGLRIGEAVRLNLSNFDLKNKQLVLRSLKSGRLDVLKIQEALFSLTLKYIREHKAEIERAKGYLFFADSKKQSYGRVEPYVNENYARNRFRLYKERAGLNDGDIYDVSEEQNGRSVRKLHLLSTHSLRHFAISKVAKATNGNLVITSRFARHSDPATTMIYVSDDKKALADALESISISDVEALKKRVSR